MSQAGKVPFDQITKEGLERAMRGEYNFPVKVSAAGRNLISKVRNYVKLLDGNSLWLKCMKVFCVKPIRLFYLIQNREHHTVSIIACLKLENTAGCYCYSMFMNLTQLKHHVTFIL